MERVERTGSGPEGPTTPGSGSPAAPLEREPSAPRPTGIARRARRRGRGQSLVEFAVVLPVFLLLLAGICDFGLGLYSQMTIINAAREGARLGVVEPGNVAAIQNRVQGMAAGLDASRLTISTTCLRPLGSGFVACSSPQWQSGDSVKVKVDYVYRMIWPLAFGTQLDLTSTVQMRIE
jgi:Flp pilus assembly protein TadG